MQTVLRIPHAGLISAAVNADFQADSTDMWYSVDPEGEYPEDVTCGCGFEPVGIPSDGVARAVVETKVQLRSIRLEFQTFLTVGRCPACASVYWCVLNWIRNYPDVRGEDSYSKVSVWGTELMETEQRLTRARLLREMEGKLVGPPVASKGGSREELERSGFIGVYQVIKPEHYGRFGGLS